MAASGTVSALRFLVADDDRINRLVLEAMLMHAGHGVIHAEDGQAAVEAFERERPDVVLMDVMMPRLDGYEATRRIRELAGEHFVPVIFLTALSDEQSLARCVEAGGDDFLSKPFSRTLLQAKISALLRTRALYMAQQNQKALLAAHARQLENEQAVAERVFANLVHRGCLNDYNIRHLISPMALFNGDLLLAARRPSGGLLVMLGDFAGHGLPAAVGAIPTAEIFYAMASKGHAVSDIVSEINCKLKSILPPELFLAACVAEFDASGRSVAVWNGGVPDVLVCGRGQEQRLQRLPSRHLPLGIVDDHLLDKTVEIVEVMPGDRIYIYSDGLIEARNPAGDMFGDERVLDIVHHKCCTPRAFGELCQAIDNFRGGTQRNDDLTLIEIVCAQQIPETSTAPRSSGVVKSATHWRFDFEAGPDLLRGADPLPALVQMLAEIQGLGEHRERLYMVLSELFNNAVDHGLLQLDSSLKAGPEGFLEYYAQRESALAALTSGRVAIRLQHAPRDAGGSLRIEVEDSGKGFDHRRHLDDLEINRTASGRGIPLVRRLCARLVYHGSGNFAEAEYVWD
jgi:CheY-like chemotaxis protein/anti-sigma regulatory factor (Ser/Thr protein kinase)